MRAVKEVKLCHYSHHMPLHCRCHWSPCKQVHWSQGKQTEKIKRLLVVKEPLRTCKPATKLGKGQNAVDHQCILKALLTAGPQDYPDLIYQVKPNKRDPNGQHAFVQTCNVSVDNVLQYIFWFRKHGYGYVDLDLDVANSVFHRAKGLNGLRGAL